MDFRVASTGACFLFLILLVCVLASTFGPVSAQKPSNAPATTASAASSSASAPSTAQNPSTSPISATEKSSRTTQIYQHEGVSVELDVQAIDAPSKNQH